jgi:hypothetical protein
MQIHIQEETKGIVVLMAEKKTMGLVEKTENGVQV